MPADVETMAYHGAVPWHGLGTEVGHLMNSVEALELAGLGWRAEKFKVLVELADGTREYIPDKRAVVRLTDNNVLGVVDKDYRIVQNIQAFQFTDGLLGEGVKYETAGALHNGKRIWLLAKVPETIKIAGDIIENYLVFTNGHDAKYGIHVAITPVRVVCQNTLTMALNKATRVWYTSHTGDVDSKMMQAKQTLRLTREYIAEMPVVAEKMIATNVYPDEAMKIIETIFPSPKMPTPRKNKRIEEIRREFQTIYTQTEDIRKFQGTAWGFYNALADLLTHWEPARKVPGYRERHLFKVTDGHPLLDRAQELLMKVRA